MPPRTKTVSQAHTQQGSAPKPSATAKGGPTDKLGLALSGGGLRAAFFHVGVLETLADLDRLRRVEIISAVSGGSIVAVMYALRLKQELAKKGGTLDKQGYVDVVKDIRERLQTGAKKNLRTRLFINPWALLPIMLGKQSLAGRMGWLFERHFFSPLLNGTHGTHIPLSELLTHQQEALDGGIERHNTHQRSKQDGTSTARVFLNATCLNSGWSYLFTANEVGDAGYGYFRIGDSDRIQALKCLTDTDRPGELSRRLEETEVSGWSRLRMHVWRRLSPSGVQNPRVSKAAELRDRLGISEAQWKRIVGIAVALGRLRALVESCQVVEPAGAGFLTKSGRLLLSKILARRSGAQDSGYSLGVIAGCDADRLVSTLVGLSFRDLRRLEDLAYWLSEYSNPTTGTKAGGDQAWRTHLAALLEEELNSLDSDFSLSKTMDQGYDLTAIEGLASVVVEVYWLRCAANASPTLRKDMEELTIGIAAGASACFPPVIPPMMLYGVYDDLVVSRLGLVDGGVYDNLGLDALVDQGCSRLIISDAGVAFEPRERAARGVLGGAGRSIETLMNAAAKRHADRFQVRARVGALLRQARSAHGEAKDLALAIARALKAHGLAEIIHVQIDPPFPQSATGTECADLLGRVRTDLDSFSDIEMTELIGHGRQRSAQELEKAGYASSADPSDLGVPLGDVAEDRRRRTLLVAHHRFFRGPRLYPKLSLGAVLGAAALLGPLGGAHQAAKLAPILLSMTGSAIAGALRSSLTYLTSVMPEGIVTTARQLVGWASSPTPWVFLALLGWWVGVVWAGRRPAPGAKRVRARRRLATGAKNLRVYFVWLLFPFVLLVALGVSLAALCAFLLSYPAMRYGRIPTLRKGR